MGNGEICKRELWFEKPLVIFEGLKKLACKCFMSGFWKHAAKQLDEVSNQFDVQKKKKKICQVSPKLPAQLYHILGIEP